MFSSCIKEWVDYYGYDQEWGYRGDAYMMSNDPSFPSDIPWEGYTFSDYRVVFSDALFNGQQKTITLDVQTDLKYADCDTVIILD